MKKLTFALITVLVLVACSAQSTATPEADTTRELVILYTNDEHGWMEAADDAGGAAEMMGLWREQEGYTEDGPFLILSGGDMWTGPAISTWFDGESMAEVMNAMGYDAAAIGNHEFDFGTAILQERMAQSEFPLLAANVRAKGTGELADFALPYVVQQVNGVQVGVIGLASTGTPQTTMPDHVAAFDFTSYREALETYVPRARADGAELLIVIGHICPEEMRALAPTAAELGVAVVGGGHCHGVYNEVVQGMTLMESGSFMDGYVRVELVFDTASDTVVSIETERKPNSGGEPDAEVAAVVAGWRTLADEELNQVIGYADKPIGRHSPAMYNLVTDAWLWAYPNADAALSNKGGFRQEIPAGEITLATIVGVLPFDNLLIDVELTGEQLIRNVECDSCSTVMGGMTSRGGYTLADGTPLDPAATYHVLVNDFMYAGGDGFRLQEYDPGAYNTAIDWRQPVIDWIRSLNTSPQNPLNDYLDPAARQR